MNLAHCHAAGVHGDDLIVETGEAPFVLGDEQRLEAALPVARNVDPQRPVFGQHGLAAGAVAVIAGFVRLVSAERVAQVVAEFGTQDAFDQRLLEGH